MKSTTTARMPETTLIRVTLSISSPQLTFVDWLLHIVGLSCCLSIVHIRIPSCYSDYSDVPCIPAHAAPEAGRFSLLRCGSAFALKTTEPFRFTQFSFDILIALPKNMRHGSRPRFLTVSNQSTHNQSTHFYCFPIRHGVRNGHQLPPISAELQVYRIPH